MRNTALPCSPLPRIVLGPQVCSRLEFKPRLASAHSGVVDVRLLSLEGVLVFRARPLPLAFLS